MPMTGRSGVDHSGIWSHAAGITQQLSEGLLPRVWSTLIGEGYSGPAVADGKVFITDAVHPDP